MLHKCRKQNKILTRDNSQFSNLTAEKQHVRNNPCSAPIFYMFIKATYMVILLVYFDGFLIKRYTTCSGTRSRGVYRKGLLPVAVLVTEGG